VGTATIVTAPVEGTQVLALRSLDAQRFVLMETKPGMPYPYVLFVEDQALSASGSKSFGEAFVELCPYLRPGALSQGCP
jgi:hypothetical protein